MVTGKRGVTKSWRMLENQRVTLHFVPRTMTCHVHNILVTRNVFRIIPVCVILPWYNWYNSYNTFSSKEAAKASFRLQFYSSTLLSRTDHTPIYGGVTKIMLQQLPGTKVHVHSWYESRSLCAYSNRPPRMFLPLPRLPHRGQSHRYPTQTLLHLLPMK